MCVLCVKQIALRNRKSIELRVGGSVEPPNIDISVVSDCVCVCVCVNLGIGVKTHVTLTV